MKQIITLAIILVLIIIAGNVAYSIYNLWSKKDLLTQTQQKLVQERQEYIQLQKQWRIVQSPSFIQQQARDNLWLAKPGETVVILPPASSSATPQEVEVAKPNWQQWWDLLF